MAKIHSLISFISKWEGDYVNDPSDPGGPTNKGVTLETWKNTGIDKDSDGDIVGKATINAINNYRNQAQLFSLIKAERTCNVMNICEKRPTLNRFLKGWLNRIASLKFSTLMITCIMACMFMSCRTVASHTDKVVASSTQVVASSEVTATETSKQTIDMTNQNIQALRTDSLVETMMMTFNFPMSEDTSEVPLPIMVKGVAIMNRIRSIKNINVTTLNENSAATETQISTTSILASATDSQVIVSETKQPHKQTNAVPVVLLLLFLLCLFFIVYLLNQYMRDKSD